MSKSQQISDCSRGRTSCRRRSAHCDSACGEVSRGITARVTDASRTRGTALSRRQSIQSPPPSPAHNCTADNACSRVRHNVASHAVTHAPQWELSPADPYINWRKHLHDGLQKYTFTEWLQFQRDNCICPDLHVRVSRRCTTVFLTIATSAADGSDRSLIRRTFTSLSAF